MKILFTVLFLDGFHGSVMHVKEIASFLASDKGGNHSITVATCFATPVLVDFFKKSNISVKTLNKIDKNIIYDIVFAYHFPTIDTLINQGLNCKKLILGSLSSVELMETFPTYWNSATLLTAMSYRTQKIHHTNYGIPLEKIFVLENHIPDTYAEYISHKKHPSQEPAHIAVVSNHIPDEIRELKNILPSHITIDFFGKQQKNYVPITPEILSNYDVIISIGKTIQYSLGLGIPSYEYDHFGGNGYISVDNIDEEAQNIFSGLPQRRKLSSKQIAHELLSEYPHIYLQVKDLKSISIERFLLSKNIKKLLQIIDDLPNFNGIQENHNLAIAHGTCCAAWLTHYKNLSYETERKYHVDYYIKHLLRIIKYSIKTAWQRSPSWLRKLVITALSWRISPHDPQAPEQPLYVLGAFASSSGLAEGARLYAQARRREGKEVICLDITHAMQQRADFPQGLEGVMAFDERQQLTRPGTVVIHANPPQFQLALLRLGKDFLHNKRILGYWAWEVETLPSIWVQALRLLDGVEVPSRFVQRAIQRHTTRPVQVIPHEVVSPSLRKTTFMEDGILRCLYSFDVSSGLNRKNPEAALRAFAEAFPQGGAELTFKVSGATAAPAAMEALRERCRSVPHVHIITDILDRDALSRLYCRHDVYLSLHRSEGYGLTIREAMLHGLHVVATGWSGNMDFMDGELSHPVPFTLVPLKEKRGPLKGLKGQWAEADTAAAAAILRKLREQLSASPLLTTSNTAARGSHAASPGRCRHPAQL